MRRFTRKKKKICIIQSNKWIWIRANIASNSVQQLLLLSYELNKFQLHYAMWCDAMRSDGSNRIIFPLSLRHRLRIAHYDCWIVFTFRRLFSYIFICYGIHFQCKMLFDTNSNKTIQNDVLLFSFLGVWFWYKIRFWRPHTFGHLN